MVPLASQKHPYSRVHDTISDLGKQDPPDAKHPPPGNSTLGRRFWGWLDTTWPLIVHCVGAIGIAILLICYVDDNHFNIRERRPSVTLADGTTIRTGRFSPLQSDISTILSATLLVLRLILAAWAGPLCWRTLFFLMEKIGLRRRDLEWLIGYGFFPPSTHLRHAFIILIAAILTSTLCAQSASPILTGSITWTPSSVSSGVKSDASISVSVATDNAVPWVYFSFPYIQAKVDIKAAGFATQAWGQDVEKGILKRVLPSATGLHINSTISNVTLPYFFVTALDWISDPQTYNLSESTISQLELGGQGAMHFDHTPGMMAIQPNASRYLPVAAVHRWGFPPPATVSETRMLILHTGKRRITQEEDNVECQKLSGRISDRFPHDMGFVNAGLDCFAFAQVTYTAGMGVCTNCRISSLSTVQNDSEIFLEPDPMTTEALWMMPNVTAHLVLMNNSIPSPWENTDDYVIEVLARSYSAAWSALQEVMTDDRSTPLVSHIHPTIPSLEAQLDWRRVYAWLALQLLVTVTGIFFLCLQSTSKYALIGDTTMVAFDLDAIDAPKDHIYSQENAESLLRIEPKDDGWKVVVDPQPILKI